MTGSRNVTTSAPVDASAIVPGTPVTGSTGEISPGVNGSFFPAGTTVTSVNGATMTLSAASLYTGTATITVQPADRNAADSITANDIRLQQTETLPAVDNGGLVYVYSFSLRPEDQAPTGSCNFSKIDNANLELKTAVTNLKTATVFARNYNVLRIRNGMGGLGYSN